MCVFGSTQCVFKEGDCDNFASVFCSANKLNQPQYLPNALVLKKSGGCERSSYSRDLLAGY